MSAGRLGGQSVAIAVEFTFGCPDAADHALADTSALICNAINRTRGASSNGATTATTSICSALAV